MILQTFYLSRWVKNNVVCQRVDLSNRYCLKLIRMIREGYLWYLLQRLRAILRILIR